MRFEPRRPITLMYAVRGFRSSQTVSVTVYDSNGSEALASSSMTEIGSTGVYSKRFSPGKSDTYFAIADCTEYPKKDVQVLVVGGKPGDISMGGYVQRLEKGVWDRKEKDLLLKVVSRFAKKFSALEDNQVRIRTNQVRIKTEIGKFFKSKSELDSVLQNIQQSLNDHGTTLDIKNENLNSFLAGKIDSFQINLEKTSENFINKLKKVGSAEILHKLESFSILADEVNVSLNQLSLDKSSRQLNENLNRLIPQMDELRLILNIKNGSSKEI